MPDAKLIRFYSPIPDNEHRAEIMKMPPPFVGVVDLESLDQFNRVPKHPQYIRAFGPGRFSDGVTLLRDELVQHLPKLAATFPV